MSEGFVYVIHAVGTNRVKVGFSLTPEKRLIELQTGSPFPLSLIGKREGTIGLERAIHFRLREHWQTGEWFEIDPAQCWEIVCAEPLPVPTIHAPDGIACKGMFQPATELSHVPVALYEIQFLATRGRCEEILPLIQSVIAVTQSRPDCLADLPQDQIMAIFEQRHAA